MKFIESLVKSHNLPVFIYPVFIYNEKGKLCGRPQKVKKG